MCGMKFILIGTIPITILALYHGYDFTDSRDFRAIGGSKSGPKTRSTNAISMTIMALHHCQDYTASKDFGSIRGSKNYARIIETGVVLIPILALQRGEHCIATEILVALRLN